MDKTQTANQYWDWCFSKHPMMEKIMPQTAKLPPPFVVVDIGAEGDPLIVQCLNCGWFGGSENVQGHKCIEQNHMEKL